jgi:hypothetical protein
MDCTVGVERAGLAGLPFGAPRTFTIQDEKDQFVQISAREIAKVLVLIKMTNRVRGSTTIILRSTYSMASQESSGAESRIDS